MIKILAGGKVNRGWLQEACDEYEKRLRKPFNVTWQFCAEADLANKVIALKADAFVVLLDERGKMLNSPELSQCLGDVLETGREVVIVLGGAFGHFPPELVARADLVWSLSRLVLPHQICRLVVAEQVYRAQEIWLGHPYHHA